jgi:hypothetical protein
MSVMGATPRLFEKPFERLCERLFCLSAAAGSLTCGASYDDVEAFVGALRGGHGEQQLCCYA